MHHKSPVSLVKHLTCLTKEINGPRVALNRRLKARPAPTADNAPVAWNTAYQQTRTNKIRDDLDLSDLALNIEQTLSSRITERERSLSADDLPAYVISLLLQASDLRNAKLSV
jgi:hypothetical protein